MGRVRVVLEGTKGRASSRGGFYLGNSNLRIPPEGKDGVVSVQDIGPTFRDLPRGSVFQIASGGPRVKLNTSEFYHIHNDHTYDVGSPNTRVKPDYPVDVVWTPEG